MKKELWNGHLIRFVEINNEWWAVAKDIADALDYAETRNMMKLVPYQYTSSSKLNESIKSRILISEFGIYKAIFGSHKPEAEQFQEWVFEVIKKLRQSSGLEGFQVFRMLDKEHQRDMMNHLSSSLKHPKRVDFIKANTIANKVVSIEFGYEKMVKKDAMSPDMLVARQERLEDTVSLMEVKEKFGLSLSISEEVYKLADKSKQLYKGE